MGDLIGRMLGHYRITAKLGEVLRRGFGLDQIESTPGLDDLRADPRFKALVKSAG